MKPAIEARTDLNVDASLQLAPDLGVGNVEEHQREDVARQQVMSNTLV
jgi:hypothetical protein